MVQYPATLEGFVKKVLDGAQPFKSLLLAPKDTALLLGDGGNKMIYAFDKDHRNRSRYL